jgi:hypothetical protein
MAVVQLPDVPMRRGHFLDQESSLRHGRGVMPSFMLGTHVAARL